MAVTSGALQSVDPQTNDAPEGKRRMQIGLGDLLKLRDELVGVGHETIGLLKHNVLAQKRRGALHIGQR